MFLKHYLEQLDYLNIPSFLIKYLKTPSLVRLKKVGYFCGMDYASNDIYDFSEYISRFDHSLTVSLIVYKLTKDKTKTLAGLFHDIATPCFSHVIDYMNNDYLKQESTEEYTEKIIMNDLYLKKCLKEDNIDINDIINFKQFSIVDNKRPKLCADRIDGVILNGIGWTKNIKEDDITNIVNDMYLYINEDDEEEIGFKTYNVAKKVIDVNNSVNKCCHSKEDNYMMNLLANITKIAIDRKYISYDDLYFLNEEELFKLLKIINDKNINYLLFEFESIKKAQIPIIDLPNVKIRNIKPIVRERRIE